MNKLSKRKKVIIWGASGHAKVILGALGPEYQVLCFVDLHNKLESFLNLPVLHSLEDLIVFLSSLPKEPIFFVLAIGGFKGDQRLTIHYSLINEGLIPMTVIHPTAWVDPSAHIAIGAQILAMSCVSADASIGVQTIINTNATVDHETIIGDGCHVMPAATIAGCCRIHDFCSIGSNATILPRLEVQRETIIGAGAVVTKNIVKKGTFIGVPAREME